MTTRYGPSPWLASVPASRVPAYPRHRGRLDADVAVIGGGLTGCATAYAFAAAGVKVVLVESDRIGRATSGSASGWIAGDPGVNFMQVEQALGLRATRRAWQLWRRAALDFIALIRRLDLKCRLEPQGTLTIASAAEEARLRLEQKARRDAGLDGALVNARAVAVEVAASAAAGLRSRDGATLDPYRAAIGIAAAAAARGARIFEKSPARRTTFSRKSAVVHTSGGAIRVKRVIVATGTPTSLFKSLRRHFWFKSSYLALTDRVPAKVRRQLGLRATVVRDLAVSPHIIRWVNGERLLVTGADGDTVPPRQRHKTIIQRTGQLMYELSTIYPDISGLRPDYGWEAPYARTAEGLPYIGPHRNFPHHRFAFGDESHSVTGAYLASRIFLRDFLDEADSADEAFAFTR
jgi:glycine/D-amino acid oxidase-like deaminating enzyme